MSRRSNRVALAVLLALLAVARVLLHRIESPYPLDDGLAVNTIEYVLLAALAWIVAAATLGA